MLFPVVRSVCLPKSTIGQHGYKQAGVKFTLELPTICLRIRKGIQYRMDTIQVQIVHVSEIDSLLVYGGLVFLFVGM